MFRRGVLVEIIVLKRSLEPVDRSGMDRRLHPRPLVQFEAKVTNSEGRSCLGRVRDMSEAGISVIVPLQFAPGDVVQLDMADSELAGRVAYCNAEDAQFRVGIEILNVHLGNSGLSSLLEATLREAMPLTPGVEHALSDLD